MINPTDGKSKRVTNILPVVAVILLAVIAGQAICETGGEAGSGRAGRHERIRMVTGEVAAGSEARENLRILCDEIGGRLSGTEGGKLWSPMKR